MYSCDDTLITLDVANLIMNLETKCDVLKRRAKDIEKVNQQLLKKLNDIENENKDLKERVSILEQKYNEIEIFILNYNK